MDLFYKLLQKYNKAEWGITFKFHIKAKLIKRSPAVPTNFDVAFHHYYRLIRKPQLNTRLAFEESIALKNFGKIFTLYVGITSAIYAQSTRKQRNANYS